MNTSDWDDLYDCHGPILIKEEERYEKVRGLMDELIVELYGNLKSGWDLREIHNLVSVIAGEMDLYVPENSLKERNIA